jgi:long-chain fatty acid transport protein
MHRFIHALALLLAFSAQAAGFYFGDNGAKAMQTGGAFAGQADDLTALLYNPAGLTQVQGAQVLVEGAILSHTVTFQRRDPGFAPGSTPTGTEPVEVNNRNGPGNGFLGLAGGNFILPFIAAGYGFQLFGRAATVSLGIYGPPASGRYAYPQPDYTKAGTPLRYVANPKRNAPQRYGLIANDIVLFYPSLSLAYALHPRFQVGVSLQLVLSNFTFRQAVSSAIRTPESLREEMPEFESLIDIKVTGQTGFTAILGVMARPLDNLSIGASLRPPVPVRARGSITAQFGEAATGAQLIGDTAQLDLTLPLELRVGVHYRPLRALGLNADFVMQMWNSVDRLLLTPEVQLALGAAPPAPLAPVSIEKKWVPSYSARAGASYDLGDWVTLSAGALFETSASPDAYTSVDFAHFTRVFITGGAALHVLGHLDVLATVAGTPFLKKDIVQSEVRAASTDSSVQGGIVGAGTYGSGGLVAMLGLRGSFFGPQKVQPPPEVAPSPASP